MKALDLTSIIESSRFTVKAFEESSDGSAFIFLRWFKLAHICRPIQVGCSHKGGKQANQSSKCFYSTSISRTNTHPQYWNLHIKSPVINFFLFHYEIKFRYQYIQWPCVLFRNIWKTFAWKYAKKTLRTTQNLLLNNWGKSNPKGKKTVISLMRSRSIQSLVLHSGNGHMHKSTSCYLRLNTWRWTNF